MKKILITGATGFLGSYLAKKLISQGLHVIALKRKGSSLERLQPILKEITCYDLDQVEIAEVFKQQAPIDCVIHAATCYGRKGENEEEMIQSNLLLPLNLFTQSIAFNTPCFLNIDTVLPKALNAYSLSKSQFLEWAKQVNTAHRIHLINARLEQFYGPDLNYKSFLTTVTQTLLANEPTLPLTKGEQLRDWVHIEDTIAALLTLLREASQGKNGFSEFCVGAGNAVTIRHIVEQLKQLTGSKTQLDFGALPYRPGELMESKTDTSSLNELGWTPQITLEEGLSELISFFREA